MTTNFLPEGGESSMTKKDLIELVAKKAGLTNKASRDAVQTFLSAVRDSLKKGEKVVITGFGTFSVRKRAARPGRNPKTGAKITIAARKAPGFTPGKTLKKAVR
jgi:DNA-binding protein HU-beta